MSKLSSKNQITVPVDVLREAGLGPGDVLQIRAAGRGRHEIERLDDILERYSGTVRYPPDYLDRLRDEWDR